NSDRPYLPATAAISPSRLAWRSRRASGSIIMAPTIGGASAADKELVATPDLRKPANRRIARAMSGRIPVILNPAARSTQAAAREQAIRALTPEPELVLTGAPGEAAKLA